VKKNIREPLSLFPGMSSVGTTGIIEGF